MFHGSPGQQFEQVVVRIEPAQMAWFSGIGMRGTTSLETKDLKAGARQLITEENTEFTRREIGDAANLVYRFATWAAGDDNFHG
jgi:hypothetical protein